MKTFCEIFAGTLFAACAFFGLASPASAALSDRPSVDENDFPQNSWNGFKLDVFEVGGRKAVVISPKKPRADKAWAIKPAWFLAFANAERELLNRGFYIAFYDLSYTYASPEALKALDDFYETCRSKYSLAKKVSLIGMSRGGLTSLMWANKHPCKTACVYVDNPVCDSLSISSAEWLDGLKKEWNICDLKGFKGSPIFNYQNLAKSKTPVLVVSAGKDEAVNYEKNEKIYVENFKKAGGDITEIFRPENKHHPHGFSDPAIVADFIENAQQCK
ncbi:MAG: alpha/beta hydrolase [Opitutales bacterium]|nr:alpha/beta hydrolase [Opitutales bacterium]